MQIEAVTKTVYEDVWDWRLENDNKPIWTRNPKDVSDEAYNEFFKQTFSEFLDPLAHVHFNVEVRTCPVQEGGVHLLLASIMCLRCECMPVLQVASVGAVTKGCRKYSGSARSLEPSSWAAASVPSLH